MLFFPRLFPSLHFTDIAEANTGIDSCVCWREWGESAGRFEQPRKGSTATVIKGMVTCLEPPPVPPLTAQYPLSPSEGSCLCL